MPSPLPSSFASAAAGISQESSSGPRRDMNSGEWARNRLNGATQTFRRPSVATNQSHTRESASASSTPTVGAYIPPHLSSNYQSGPTRGANGNDSRYSKEQLLDVFKNQRESVDVADFLVGDWNNRDEAVSTNGHWGKRNDFNHAGPEVCWDSTGQMRPLAFQGMSDEEKNLFSGSVNSPLKPPPQGGSKDNAATGAANRKTSVGQTQSHLNSLNTSSPGSARPNPRRRGTGDSGGHTMSPTPNTRFFRDESNTTTPPPALLRRKTDFRDSSDAKLEERPKDRDSSLDLSSPYGTLKRSVTNPLTSSNGPASPWSAAAPSQNTGFSSMGGAFGSFNIGPITPGATDKKASFGSLRGESRFKSLLSKGSSEDVGGVSKDKSVGLERLPETDNDVSRQLPARLVQTRTNRSDTNPFDETRNGSATLGGQDISTPASGIDQFGLSTFGIPSTSMAPAGLMSAAQQSASRHEPMSPTNTNPYQSPHGDKIVEPEDIDTDGSDIHPVHLPNLSELQDDPAPASFGSLQRNAPVEGPAGDRSQTSSVGATRGFPSLGGLGGLPSLSSPGGWPVSAAGGTPTRERSAFSTGFGDPIFGSMADLQSPSLAGLGGGGFFGSHTAGLGASTPTSNRPSKLGSLFPPAMQDQMRGDQARQDLGGNENVTKSQGPSSPERAAAMNASIAAPGPLGMVPGQSLTSSQPLSDQSPQAPQNVTQNGATSGQIPTTQQRQMVMPDRMRWIYRDPQGNMQGPWSGLEMHDWFKAGFFTADLQVKKLEDTEYEPLAQLVRRIGNSREPFLVPQIGVPHGSPAAGSWSTPGPNGGVQPPFPSSFPSFGTTLTAEQQNALERRKQEEQYLMARQKEHLAQQQAMMKQMQIQQVAAATTPIHPHPLQHHPSAHSLHSQPSYGSITSPGGFQPPQMQAPIQPPQAQAVPGFFEPPPRQNTMPNLTPQMQQPSTVGGPEELPGLMDRLNVNRSAQFPFGTAENHSQQVATMLQDRARLQEEQDQFNRSKQTDSIFDMQAREERLRQFHALRGASDEDINVRRTDGLPTHPVGLPSSNEPLQQGQHQPMEHEHVDEQIMEEIQHAHPSIEQPLSLSQQVQKAASQRQQEQAQASTQQDESEWKADHGLPQPFPPPPSASPLPAPAAQRNRQNVADALAVESRSQTQTPVEAATTSIAPWAKDINDAPKGPSLKEIQEAEARQAAKLEEAAAAARRALAEQERANQPPPPAPGLPSTANWASATSTTPTPSVGPAWGKAGKGQLAAAPAAPKKTLAQIQKEEEARKQRQQAAAVTSTSSVQATMPSPATSAGKRYADLASKVTPQAAVVSGGAWTTVGAGGKPKPAPPAPVPQRSVTSTTPVSAAAKPRPVATVTRSATMAMPPTAVANPNKAAEELTKWAKMSLGRGLNSSINVDDFVQQLLILPAETEIISDSVYANSQTLDGRRFAEEYVRRRKLADKGIVDPAVVNVGAFGGYDQKSSSDGWNEVAKKGQSHAHREESNTDAAFKVVASKKKGKR